MQTVIVTDDLDSWSFLSDLAPIVPALEYLSGDEYHQSKSYRVINLCASYDYQTIGYYVSLLAQARDHKALDARARRQDLQGSQAP